MCTADQSFGYHVTTYLSRLFYTLYSFRVLVAWLFHFGHFNPWLNWFVLVLFCSFLFFFVLFCSPQEYTSCIWFLDRTMRSCRELRYQTLLRLKLKDNLAPGFPRKGKGWTTCFPIIEEDLFQQEMTPWAHHYLSSHLQPRNYVTWTYLSLWCWPQMLVKI